MRFSPFVFLIAVLLFAVPARAQDAAKPFTFQDCDACPLMTLVQPGTFTMGSDEAKKYEGPAHPVTIKRPFAIGVHEVTFDEWKACVEAGRCGGALPDDHDWGRENRPVINVTWADAVEYTQWLSKLTGQTYRLPSEAEWEYAARAGTDGNYWWGDEVGKGKANCRDCGETISHQTEPVDSFEPNPWGLYNVHGNVWEWVADCWNPSHKGAPADGSPRIDGDCNSRVVRSGSWYYFSKNLASAWRFKNDARVRSYGIGFRVVRDVPH
ncbi:MAG: formylglycine-generating enzyme family protein [Alphaproteobacteria bacterium]|nr:formylglycine-generating enzyme family protein [Alphaproteobacteria bacterium]MBF0250984.1 formylglycine-generating enzyme family protein [Alphaproteobacteria bacterium]